MEGQTQARHPLAMVSLEPSAWPPSKPQGAHLVFSMALPAILPYRPLCLFSRADYSFGGQCPAIGLFSL